jgi:kanamycin kinase
MGSASVAGRPIGSVDVPKVVMSLADDDPIEAVWRNQLGGMTFRLAAGTRRDRYVKWVAAGTTEIDLTGEATRLRWLDGRVPVPRLLAAGADSEGSWLVTEALPARSAVEPPWVERPATAAAAIGAGLRAFHDTLPVDECPFSWDAESRLRRAEVRMRAGAGSGDWFPEHRRLPVDDAWARLNSPPPIDRLVVCHGDACAPNTLLGDGGRFAAHVDLGQLGVADRWADLAVAAWSTEWNYGIGYDTVVYAAYGVNADPARISYYRLLWDVG